MKRAIFGAGFAFAFGVAAEEPGSVEKDCGKESLGGFYLSLGGGYSHQESKTDIIGIDFDLDVGSPANAGAAQADFARMGFEAYVSGSNVVGRKRGNCGNSKSDNGKLNGTVAVGYGGFINDVYLGAECCLDVGANDKKRIKLDIDGVEIECAVKKYCVVPHLRARLGYYFSQINGMLYATAGVTHVKVDCDGVNDFSGGISLSKVVPSLGLGFEKPLGRAISVRVEGEYKFKSGKTGDISSPEGGNVTFHNKIKSDVYSARLTFTCHI